MEFDTDTGKYPNGCRIFMENLANKVVSSPQYWINEEYKFSFTHTLNNLDNFKENYLWITASVIHWDETTYTTKSTVEFESQVSFPITTSTINVYTISQAPGSVTEINFLIENIRKTLSPTLNLYLNFIDGLWPSEIIRRTNITDIHV